MEHSSRPGDRQQVMNIVRKNILSLSCRSLNLSLVQALDSIVRLLFKGHKYASNVIEKALQCATPEERSHLVEAGFTTCHTPLEPLFIEIDQNRNA